jgi:integrase
LLYRQPRPPKAVVDIERLYQLGIEMMQTAGADLAQDDLAVAEQFRDGLIFAFMAMRPLRRSNMVGLHLGLELLTTRGGYRVVLPPEAYKTSVPFEFAVPDQLAPYMRLYLEVHRPVLAAGGRAKGGTSVWLNRTGRPVNGDDLRKIVRGRSEQALGIALNPHDFRHCAASSIVTVTPADWMIIKVILGHSTPRMAERHYIHAKGIVAARGYQELVDQRREAAARRLRRAR